jgi:acyl-CoA synthetase (NDP forming)
MDGDLNPLFRPKSVAVVGASAKPGKIGNVVLRNLLSGDFAVYPVNPHETEILGLKCYPSLSEVPHEVEMALVILPARFSLPVVREAVEKGVGLVVVTSSGFSERGADGRALQDSLVSAVKGSRTRILGPNTMGVVVPESRLDTFFISDDRSPRPGSGSVAIVSQSGAIAVSCLEKAEASGMGISACVCLGNKADIDEVDMIEHFAADTETRCIALYLESFSDGRRFLKAASDAAVAKPVVLLKAGRTRAGSAAARSHTGAIAAGSDAVVDGALAQAGVVRVYDEEELVDIARALSVIDHADGDRVCLVASAGGFGVIGADMVESSRDGMGLRMAVLAEATLSVLEGALPEFSSAQNPVDLTAEVADSMYDEALDALRADGGVDAIIMSLELQPPNVTEGLLDIAEKHASSPGTPIVISLFAKDQSSIIRQLAGRGLVAYPTIRRSVRAVAALSERGAYLRRNRQPEGI